MKQNRFLTSAIAILMASAITIIATDTYTGTLLVTPQITHKSVGASTLSETIQTVYQWTLTQSAGATYVNNLYVSNGTLAAGATNTVDLYGTLANSFGVTLNMVCIKGLILCPSNSVGGTVTIRPAAANGISGLFEDTSGAIVRSRGCYSTFAMDTNGYAVANASADSIEIVNNATNTTTYQLIIFGE